MATSPSTALRNRVIVAMNSEFAPLAAIHDKLDDSVGEDGDYLAVYPEEEVPSFGTDATLEVSVVAQYYGQYEKVVDRYQTANPSVIEEKAERLRRKLQAPYVGDAHDWFLSVRRVEYPDDPTGNKTRFLMYITGYSQNPQVIETTG